MNLIVNGDDFGITHACNLAMVDCFKNGIMRSVSMMTNMPGTCEAADIWKKNPELSVGIHFSLSAGRPLTDARTLIKDDGTFDKSILKECSKADPEEIEKELQAQFNRFVELTGRYPEHINSHHGIESIACGAQLLQEYSRTYHLPIRRFLNRIETREEEIYHIDFQVPELKMMIKDDGRRPFEPADVIESFSREELESDGIFELAGHPGYVDRELFQISSLTIGRCYDAYNFSCDQTKAWIKENNIQLITYKDIPLK